MSVAVGNTVVLVELNVVLLSAAPVNKLMVPEVGATTEPLLVTVKAPPRARSPEATIFP